MILLTENHSKNQNKGYKKKAKGLSKWTNQVYRQKNRKKQLEEKKKKSNDTQIIQPSLEEKKSEKKNDEEKVSNGDVKIDIPNVQNKKLKQKLHEEKDDLNLKEVHSKQIVKADNKGVVSSEIIIPNSGHKKSKQKIQEKKESLVRNTEIIKVNLEKEQKKQKLEDKLISLDEAKTTEHISEVKELKYKTQNEKQSLSGGAALIKVNIEKQYSDPKPQEKTMLSSDESTIKHGSEIVKPKKEKKEKHSEHEVPKEKESFK